MRECAKLLTALLAVGLFAAVAFGDVNDKQKAEGNASSTEVSPAKKVAEPSVETPDKTKNKEAGENPDTVQTPPENQVAPEPDNSTAASAVQPPPENQVAPGSQDSADVQNQGKKNGLSTGTVILIIGAVVLAGVLGVIGGIEIDKKLNSGKKDLGNGGNASPRTNISTGVAGRYGNTASTTAASNIKADVKAAVKEAIVEENIVQSVVEALSAQNEEKCSDLQNQVNELNAQRSKSEEELRTARSENATLTEKLEVAKRERDQYKTDFDAASAARDKLDFDLNAANEAKQELETLNADKEAEIGQIGGFYGETSELLRRKLFEERHFDLPVCRMLAAAWLRLESTKEVFSQDELRDALEIFDSTLWGIFNENDIENLQIVREYFTPYIAALLDGTDLEFSWPEPGTELDGHDDEFRVESGYRAVLYAKCGLIRANGDVVTKSRVVCENE